MKNVLTLENSAVERIFAERKDFIIIGLTGRTGCGCTTVAQLLCKSFKDMQPPIPSDNESIEGREYSIIYEYVKNAWIPFRLIEMKHVIFTFILEHDYDTTSEFINKIANEKIDISTYKETYTMLHEKRMKWKNETITSNEKGEGVPSSDDIFSFYFNEIPMHYVEFQKLIPIGVYTKLLQQIGDNIRASGDVFSNSIVPQNVLNLSQRVNMLIKILRKRNLKEKQRVLVVIDAFRNPYEATFFKDRYSAFYLFAVNASDDERQNRLVQKGFTYTSFIDLDEKEYPSLNNSINDFFHINIEKTVEIADVHINNSDSKSKNYAAAKRQVIRYVGLIMHPGLVPPTQIEYCMQVAFDSKLNSGCLSRLVGAVISDKEYNIIATGWNTAPANQIPCSLRSLLTLVRDDKDDEIGMSEYERTDTEYREFLRSKVAKIDFSLLDGRNCSYCFKDAYNAYKGQKNQVHTRSVHAEEMAFLQSSRIGAPSVRGGYLFTTASPCELCSKKACHTGISKIYYIDQYPGISYKHILNCGKDSPKMIPFSGAIGRAYTQLYTQVLPYKDELYMLLGLTFKKGTMKYAAFFKEINFDGKNIVKMEELKQMLLDLGLREVNTYIQSGNVVFETNLDEASLHDVIYNGFYERFGFNSCVIIRNENEIRALISNCPFSEEEIATSEATDSHVEHIYVYFLDNSLEKILIDNSCMENCGSDILRVGKRELYLLCNQSIQKSKLAMHIEKIFDSATVRDWETVNKLNAMLSDL